MNELITSRLRPIVQASGLTRKEISQTLRQPQLLLLLVAGPFVILVIFGFGYDEDQLALRTAFVGPADSIYETALEEHDEMLSEYVTPSGYTSDLFAARQRLEQGDIDLIVIFPEDAGGQLAEGEQASITILHDKLDPIQLSMVEIASRLAVAEVNATILETLVEEGLEGMRPLSDHLDQAVAAADALEAAARADDPSAVREHREALDRALSGAETAATASATVMRELDLSNEAENEAFDEVLDELGSLRTRVQTASADDAAGIATQTSALVDQATVLVNIPPRVIARPFYNVTERLGRQYISPTGYFAPSTIALLIAHLGVTFAAMSVIADRRLGVFESYRVAPLGSVQVMAAKYLAYLLLGSAVGAALLAAVVLALDVPLVGAVPWVAVAIVGLVLGSVGLGLIVAAAARTDSQAVQYSMLVLLASLFFGGFFLELDAFAWPVQALAHVLPVTYGISMLHDVMLRGLDPQTLDLVGLGTLSVVYCAVASMLMRWQLRA